MTRKLLGWLIAATALGAPTTLGATDFPNHAVPGAWSGDGALEGSPKCSSPFTLAFTVSPTGAITGTLDVLQGSAGFAGIYTLAGQVEAADGRTLKARAARVHVVTLEGRFDGVTVEGLVNSERKATCYGVWSATLDEGGS
jgi:hypothetical protein